MLVLETMDHLESRTELVHIPPEPFQHCRCSMDIEWSMPADPENLISPILAMKLRINLLQQIIPYPVLFPDSEGFPH
jgi:hypothetical protein